MIFIEENVLINQSDQQIMNSFNKSSSCAEDQPMFHFPNMKDKCQPENRVKQ